jgi:predicted glycosyltransferase
MNARRRVFFYVQHLLGIGHQRRGATLARAMQQAGLDVAFVSGGHDVPNLDLGGARLVQLPATQAVDLYFKQLVDEDDRRSTTPGAPAAPSGCSPPGASSSRTS